MLDGEQTTDQIMASAVDYVRRSVPDAVQALKAPDSIIRQIVEAKLMEVIATDASPPA